MYNAWNWLLSALKSLKAKPKVNQDIQAKETPVSGEKELFAAPAVASPTRDAAIRYVLDNEGGYANVPQDSGGPTNYGITQADYSRYLGRHASALDVKHMPISDAIEIYRRKYWQAAYDQIDPACATVIMDWGVLHGPVSARMLAQRIAGVGQDGVFGPATIDAINKMTPKTFVYAFSNGVALWMRSRAAEKPSQRVFLKGWLARAARMKTLVK